LAVAASGFSTKRAIFLDIAEASFRAGRDQAEGHQPAFIGQLAGVIDGAHESLRIVDQLIGGQDQ
jgi:hypothetical protein